MNKLDKLKDLGQSMWLDYIDRSMIESGKLNQLIAQGIRGMTSNPAIFNKVISNGDAYDVQLHELFNGDGKSAEEIYEALAIRDVQDAADALRPVYDASNSVDGYISLEANPHLAFDTQGTVDEIYRLREMVDRPNVMYKIPATTEGIIAVEQLISKGININITLMFSMEHYEKVAEAYISGLNKYVMSGGDVSQVASVASFFVSRVDVKVDKWLQEMGNTTLQGKIALANAKQVYQRFQEIFSSEHWQSLAAKGAHVQRPLWASTSTKNPAYPDTLYVDNLIGEHTVNTVPMETLEAFLDHGTVALTIEDNLPEVRQQLHELEALDIHLNNVGEELQQEGIGKFNEPFDRLMATLNKKRQEEPTT